MKTNKSDYLNLKSMNHIISEISRCDVILRYGKEKFIGVVYDSDIADSPIVKCKGDYEYNYFLMKAGEMLGVPCVEHKLLVRELFNKVEIGNLITTEYYKELATVYSNLEKYKEKDEGKDDFINKLTRDLSHQLYHTEKVHYKKLMQKILRRKKLRQQVYEGDVVKLFEEDLRKLSEKYEINIRIYHNAFFKTVEFYLESFITEYNLEFWQMVFISKEDQKIIIGTRHFFKEFDFSEALIALEVLKAIVEVCNTDFRKTAIDYCVEVKTNPKLCEIVRDTIKTMLKLNYREQGIEYGFYCDTVISAVYLRPADSDVMYELLIHHKEFLKSPEAFKEYIKSPGATAPKEYEWKKIKYNPKHLDKKFQPITP